MTPSPRPDKPGQSVARAQIVDDGLRIEITCRVELVETRPRETRTAEAADGQTPKPRRWRGRVSWTERRFAEALSE
jgi:hypothetical protein